MSKQRPIPFLSVHPRRVLMDEKLTILVNNASPFREYTLRTWLCSEDGDDWEAIGHYVSNADGTINEGLESLNRVYAQLHYFRNFGQLLCFLPFLDKLINPVCEDVCMGGTYSGQEPMGLMWSLQPVPGSRTGLCLTKEDSTTPSVVTISLYKGFQTDSFSQRQPLASTMLERWYKAPGVRRVELTEGRVTGTLFLPPGPGLFPAVLDLQGGVENLVEYPAAMLASHGFVCLVINYMNPKIKPVGGSTVGNDYFEEAYSILETHPLVMRGSIGIYGLSAGSSMALSLCVYSPIIKPRCLVCISGSHVQPAGGTLGDLLTNYYKNKVKTRYNEEKQTIMRDLLLPIPSDPSEKVDVVFWFQVGQLRCPLLLIVGEDDQAWPAEESAHDMKEMMERSGNGHLLTILSYPDTGHILFPPYTPHCRISNFVVPLSGSKAVFLWGGEAAGHNHAQEDSWLKILVFLRKHLCYGLQPDITSCL